MHSVTFYPVGNGDSSQVILQNGRRILFDFRHLTKSEDGEGPEIDLAARLRQELKEAGKKHFDVVALTHGDADHIAGSTEFFELWHAEKYKGGDRVPLPELWVPAAVLLEEVTQDCRSAEFAIWRAEARHRLREGKGIRVFSKPEQLKEWLAANGLSVDARRSLITDAGQLVPGFTLAQDGVEFFCHSPFIKHVDDGEDMRNSCALIFNVRFQAGANTFDYLAIGDTDWEVLEDIHDATSVHGNLDRLKWDLFNIPHHCSYKALSAEKGDAKTVPHSKVEVILKGGNSGAFIICSSNPIEDSYEGRSQEQPPHVQAKSCYVDYLRQAGGAHFLTTMEEPSSARPEPIVIVIDGSGLTRKRAARSGSARLLAASAPRAG